MKGALGDPRLRQSIATWLALYPLLTLILWALETPLAQLALPLRTLVLTVVLVPLMVYALVPWVAKMLNRYAPAKQTIRRGPPPRR